MSVIIKGLNKPQSCGDCWADDWFCDRWRKRNWGMKPPDDCPIEDVPPHGRLIDADALGASLRETIDECHKWANEVDGGEMYARVSQALGTFVECRLRVKVAPTIIPAEETLKEEA